MGARERVRGMVHTTRNLLSYGSVLVVLATGCGDGDGSGADPEDMGKPDGGSMSSDNDAAQDASPQLPDAAVAFREACVGACKAQGQCLGFSDSDCMVACDTQAVELDSSCLDEAKAEQDCLAGLTCDQAKAYGTEGRRQHPVCGAQANAYFAACTLDAGATPAACGALCARYEACDASERSVSACEERCILQVTSNSSTSAACGAAFQAFLACAAQAECDEVKDLAVSSLSPIACNDELETMNKACL